MRRRGSGAWMSWAGVTVAAVWLLMVAAPGDAQQPAAGGVVAPGCVGKGPASLVGQIVAAAAEQRIPVGIIVDGGGLCARKTLEVTSPVTVQSLEDEISRSVEGYEAVEDDGILVVRPEVMPPATEELLRLRLGPIDTPAMKFSELEFPLFLNVRAVLVPNEATGFEELTGAAEPMLPPLRMQDPSVEELLNAAATSAGKGAWVLSAVSETWLKKPNTSPWIVVGYPVPSYKEWDGVCAVQRGAR